MWAPLKVELLAGFSLRVAMVLLLTPAGCFWRWGSEGLLCVRRSSEQVEMDEIFVSVCGIHLRPYLDKTIQNTHCSEVSSPILMGAGQQY